MKTTLKNEDTLIGLRRYLHRLMKVSSSANEGTFVKMARFLVCPLSLSPQNNPYKNL